MELNWVLEQVEKRMKPKRFRHTLGVVETAAKLGAHYQLDIKKLKIAAAVHDYAKYCSDTEMWGYIDQYGLHVDAVMKDHIQLAHGIVGAELVREELGIEDEEILNSVRYHTYGRKGMTPFEMVIYLADAIEPERKYEGVDRLRKLAKRSLELAMLESLNHTIDYVVRRNGLLHLNSVELRNQLILQQEALKHE